MKNFRYWDWYKLTDYILPTILVGSIIEYVLGFWSITTVVKTAAVIISFVITIKTINNKNGFKILLFSYILYCLLTGISYLWNGKSISFYFEDVSNYLLPMLFVCIGISDNRPSRNFYDNLVKILAVVLVLGLICYLAPLPWYTTRMAEIRNDSMDYYSVNSDTVLDNLRFCAFFKTSYPVSHFTSFGIAIVLFNIFRRDVRVKYTVLTLVILLVSSLLCQHRVAILCAGLFLALAIMYGVQHKESDKLRPVIFLVIAVVVIVVYLFAFVERFQDLFVMLNERLDDISLSGALEERKQIDEVFASWNNVFLGEGIGSGGAAPRQAGLYGITDQNYAKLLYETGIVGCFFFAILIIPTFIRGLKYYRVYATELLIMIFVLVAMMGSNTLCFYYLYILPFWYGVGRIWNKKYLKIAKKNRIVI